MNKKSSNKRLEDIVNSVLNELNFTINKLEDFKRWEIRGTKWISATVVAEPSRGYAKTESYHYTLINVRLNIEKDNSSKNGHKLTPASVNYEIHVFLDWENKSLLAEDFLKFNDFGKKRGDYHVDIFFKDEIYSKEAEGVLTELEDILVSFSKKANLSPLPNEKQTTL